MSVPSPFARRCRSILAAARSFWGDSRLRAARKPDRVRLCLEGFEPRIVPTVTVDLDPTTHVATIVNAADAGETVTLGTTTGASTLTVVTSTNAPKTDTPPSGSTPGVTILGNTATITDLQLNKVVLSTDLNNFLNVTAQDLSAAVSLREVDYTGSNDTAGDSVDLSANLDPNIFFKFDMMGAPGATNFDNFVAAKAGVNILQFSDRAAPSTLQVDLTAANNAGNTKIALDFSGLTSASSGATVNLGTTGSSLGQVYTNQTINFLTPGQASFITGLIGSPSADNLTGNALNDYFVGNGGNDTMTSGGGNNLFIAFQDFENQVTDLTQFASLAADPTMNTGTFGFFGYGKGTTDFNASFTAANGATGPAGSPTVVMNGGAGNDSFFGFNGVSVSVLGGGGTGVYSTNTNGGTATIDLSADTAATVFGASGDTITGSQGNDTLTMRTIANSTQVTVITLGAGNNSVVGTQGADSIMSTSGNDTIFGNGGADTLIAGTGNDVLSSGDAGTGGVLFQTGNSPTTVNAFSGADTVMGNLSNDTIVGFPVLEQNVTSTSGSTTTGGTTGP
jgi:hypothetical protein